MNSYERTARPVHDNPGKKLGKTLPLWLLVFICVAIGSGAAMGTVLAGDISGVVPVAVSQSILIDGAGFDIDDVTFGDGTAIGRAHVSTADQNTGFQVATEVAVGDKFLISIPVINASNNPIIGLITLEQCSTGGLQLDVDERSLLALTHVTAPPEDAAARGAPLSVGTHIYQTRYWTLADADDDGVVDVNDVIMATAVGDTGTVTVNAVNAVLGQITYTVSGVITALTADYWYGSEITMLAQVGPCQWKFQADGSVGNNKSGDIEIIVAHPDSGAPDYYRINGTIEQIRF